MKRLWIALPLLAGACGEGVVERDPAELEAATTDGEAALAGAIEPGDFAELRLGAKIEGPQGPTPSGSLTNEAGAFADITSYVACPAGMEVCDPGTAPPGTIYTYVHTVYPGEDNDPATGSGRGADASDVEAADGFRLVRPAHGFTGQAGYSKAEALAAAGRNAQLTITCLDGGLVWSINAGDGGDQWEQSEPLTFWWQSVIPPAGLAPAYAIDADGTRATGPRAVPGCAKRGIERLPILIASPTER